MAKGQEDKEASRMRNVRPDIIGINSAIPQSGAE